MRVERENSLPKITIAQIRKNNTSVFVMNMMKQITPFHTNNKSQITKKRREMRYEPKNVLITGGAGFIASHVAILFAKKYPHCKVSKETLLVFFFFFFFFFVVVVYVVVCAVFRIFFCGRQRSSRASF